MGLEILPTLEEVDLCVLGRVILSFCLLKYFSDIPSRKRKLPFNPRKLLLFHLHSCQNVNCIMNRLSYHIL